MTVRTKKPKRNKILPSHFKVKKALIETVGPCLDAWTYQHLWEMDVRQLHCYKTLLAAVEGWELITRQHQGGSLTTDQQKANKKENKAGS